MAGDSVTCEAVAWRLGHLGPSLSHWLAGPFAESSRHGRRCRYRRQEWANGRRLARGGCGPRAALRRETGEARTGLSQKPCRVQQREAPAATGQASRAKSPSVSLPLLLSLLFPCSHSATPIPILAPPATCCSLRPAVLLPVCCRCCCLRGPSVHCS